VPFVIAFTAVFTCLSLEWWWYRPTGSARAACAALKLQSSLPARDRLVAALVEVQFRPKPPHRRCEEVYFTESQLDQGEWQVARPLQAGQILFPADVVAARRVVLPRGKRAYSASFTSEVAVAPGDYVEIFSTDAPLPLVPAALVLASVRRSALELVLALSSDEIRSMEKAARKGTLSIALVHPDDVRFAGARKRPRVKQHSPRALIWSEE
jgi:Flp pilus assembly protein CpaB